jgi:hypothetical protein
VLASRSLDASEKRRIGDALLSISTWPLRLDGERAGQRPLEVTIVAVPEVVPWRYPPRMELQFGEWLRRTFEAGDLDSAPAPSPDLAVLIESVRREARVLVGPPPRALLRAVPPADLAAAMLDGVDGLLAELETDTTNVLLTLARMWFTIETGELAPKDLAAEWGIARLAKDDRAILEHARAIYLGTEPAGWRESAARIGQVANRLAGQVRRAAEQAGVATVR